MKCKPQSATLQIQTQGSSQPSLDGQVSVTVSEHSIPWPCSAWKFSLMCKWPQRDCSGLQVRERSDLGNIRSQCRGQGSGRGLTWGLSGPSAGVRGQGEAWLGEYQVPIHPWKGCTLFTLQCVCMCVCVWPLYIYVHVCIHTQIYNIFTDPCSTSVKTSTAVAVLSKLWYWWSVYLHHTVDIQVSGIINAVLHLLLGN